MTDDDKMRLANVVIDAVAQQSAMHIRVWLDGFISALPQEIVIDINKRVLNDARYQDAVTRTHRWHTKEPEILVSWTHVSPETEKSLRAAAAWRSSPFTRAAADPAAFESEKWGNGAFLNERGVALWLFAESPWPESVQSIIDVVTPKKSVVHIVLCHNGRVIDGLPTWPRA